MITMGWEREITYGFYNHYFKIKNTGSVCYSGRNPEFGSSLTDSIYFLFFLILLAHTLQTLEKLICSLSPTATTKILSSKP
uniref:Uncharacterized protein n=1 Tax=Helianthus annuus TaxID=4232 RepID=A0A251V1G7_HELAN